MLSPATLDVAHRLIATLMTLVRAVSPVVLAGGTRTFSELAAHALFERLARLVTTLARLITDGPEPNLTRTPPPPFLLPLSPQSTPTPYELKTGV